MTLKLILSFILILPILSSCFNQKKLHAFHGKTMGTTYNVKIVADLHESESIRLAKEIDKLLVNINQKMSTYIPDSEISLLNKASANKPVSLSDELYFLIQQASSISPLVDEYYDVTIGPLVNLWGFGPGQRSSNALPSKDLIMKTKLLVGKNAYRLNSSKKSVTKQYDEVYFDLSSIAKGWGVDQISELLVDKKFEDFMVEIGGEVRVLGRNKSGAKWKIGVESPLGEGIQKIVPLNNLSMATSGNYRNYFTSDGKRYSHTINPKTGYPFDNKIASVTVITKECWRADGLATALMTQEFSKIRRLLSLDSELKDLLDDAAVYVIYRESNQFKEWSNAKFDQLLANGASK